MKKTITSFILFTFLFIGISHLVIAQPLTPLEELGKELFFDKIADPDKMSCADCHGPKVGFTGPNPAINTKGAVYKGAVPQRFGNRKPPSAAYATFSPLFHYYAPEEIYIGGNFWDGRATGAILGNPAADQAMGPFLNPVEQNNESKQAVIMQVATSKYSGLWEDVWGEPISYETELDVAENYDRIALSIAAYEASSEVNAFTSKFDYYLNGLVDLTDEEALGLALFNGIAMCSECHPSTIDPLAPPTQLGPLFTDFTFDNLGTPKNPHNPFYEMDEVYLPNGDPINPDGDAWIDKGLGRFLESMGSDDAEENMGKHKVPTLRNVGKRPGNGFPKAYMHNGVFKSLKEVVHFYNTRDVIDWPPPEVADNVNDTELGDLGLTDEQEDAIVAFLETLSDGYKLPKSTPIGNDIGISDATLAIGPNPFASSSNIAIGLPESAETTITLYELNGQKIKTIFSGLMDAGDHNLALNGDGFQAGIYIIAVQIGKEVITEKVALLK